MAGRSYPSGAPASITGQQSGRSMVPRAGSGAGWWIDRPGFMAESPVMLSASSRLGNSPSTSAGATVGGGGGVVVVVVVVVGVLVVVVGAATRAGLVSSWVTPTTNATTAEAMNTYDSVSPTRARSRPRSPVRRIWLSPRCPKSAPAGANTNANTTDSVANVLASWRGGGGGAGGGWGALRGGPGGPAPNG